jgi:hypothetical protein
LVEGLAVKIARPFLCLQNLNQWAQMLKNDFHGFLAYQREGRRVKRRRGECSKSTANKPFMGIALYPANFFTDIFSTLTD